MDVRWKRADFPKGTDFWVVRGIPVAAVPGVLPRRYDCVPPALCDDSFDFGVERAALGPEEFLLLIQEHLGSAYVDIEADPGTGWSDEQEAASMASLERHPPPENVSVQPGDRGAWVVWLQGELFMRGYDMIQADDVGVFGENTQLALRAFQRERLLWLSMDEPTGIADPETIYELSLSPEELHIRLLLSGP